MGITALDSGRQQLMDTKALLLDSIVSEVKTIVLLADQDEEATAPAGGDYNRDDADAKSEGSYKSGSVGGGSVRATRQGKPSSAGTGDAWGGTDLGGVTEQLERGLASPAATKPLFARLLVHAAGMLNCEDDIERFLLEEGE